MELIEIALSGVVLVLLIAIMKLFNLSSKVESIQENILKLAAPAQTLTQVTTALQNQVGNLNETVGMIGQSVTNISTQAMKIEEMGKKYEETEALTRRIHNIMIGSYEKGRSGENYLQNMMAELMKIGIVMQNAYVGGKVVEYSVVFSDGKLLPIDSKVVATKQMDMLFDENLTEEERSRCRATIRTELKKKIIEVTKYIDPKVTLPCAVMAVPDSIVELSSEVVPDAVQRNVMIVGYSAVPQLIVYFVRIHGFYDIQVDVGEMKDRMMSIQQELTKLDDNFFSNRFDRPLTMLNNAVLQTRNVVSGINAVLSLEYREPKKLTENSTQY
ncbi:DNA recombination protein RmuC [Candidatus Bathyarchaeota archaeon]|nr:DNA recombination protein RmuC [Candidatus Bathyarchaeota archaeon]